MTDEYGQTSADEYRYMRGDRHGQKSGDVYKQMNIDDYVMIEWG